VKVSEHDLRKKHTKCTEKEKKLSPFFYVVLKLSFWQVGYSAPTQAAIREDLNLSLAEVSIFWFSIHILIYIIQNSLF